MEPSERKIVTVLAMYCLRYIGVSGKGCDEGKKRTN